MDGVEALKALRDGKTILIEVDGLYLRWTPGGLQTRPGPLDEWAHNWADVSLFLTEKTFSVVGEYDLRFREAMRVMLDGRYAENEASPGVTYAIQDGMLMCVDPCGVSVRGLTDEEVKAKWRAVTPPSRR